MICPAGKQLNLAEDVFRLQHLLDCNILRYREDIEELTSAAVKEEQIEVKLGTIEADWATTNLVFAGELRLERACHWPLSTAQFCSSFPGVLLACKL